MRHLLLDMHFNHWESLSQIHLCHNIHYPLRIVHVEHGLWCGNYIPCAANSDDFEDMRITGSVLPMLLFNVGRCLHTFHVVNLVFLSRYHLYYQVSKMPSLISILSIALALSIAEAASNPFTLKAYLPGHPINGQVVNADGQSLYLGLPGPSSYCPTDVVPANQCPTGKKTVFIGALSMWYVILATFFRRYTSRS